MIHKMLQRMKDQAGFSLLEIVVAITILSVVALGLTAFFVHAMTYAKGNQNKTIVVNLARNALFYMEKQSYDQIKIYFMPTGVAPHETELKKISLAGCTKLAVGDISCPENEPLEQLLEGMDNVWEVLNPQVNGREYQITVTYDPSVLPTDISNKYLLPIKVEASVAGEAGNKRDWSEVEGYVTDEYIR